MKYCIVVPHFNHVQLFEDFLPQLIALALPCIVVDDGSDTHNVNKLTDLLAQLENFHLVRHQTNRGKGAAVITGCYFASTLNCTHALQIDADGQHNVNDVDELLNCSKEYPGAIVSGQPFFDESAPKVRVYGRKITDFWVALETLSFTIRDSLCGFRVYPIQAVEHICDNYYLGPRMDFDTEILVKAVWAKIDVKFIPTKVIYHENTVSHFHYLRDNGMLIKLHVRLMFGMLPRLPQLLFLRCKHLVGK